MRTPQTVTIERISAYNYLVNNKKVYTTPSKIEAAEQLTPAEDETFRKYLKLNRFRNITRSIYTP